MRSSRLIWPQDITSAMAGLAFDADTLLDRDRSGQVPDGTAPPRLGPAHSITGGKGSMPRARPARTDQDSRCPWYQTGVVSQRQPRPPPGSPGTVASRASPPRAGARSAAAAPAQQRSPARIPPMSSRDPTGHRRPTAATGARNSPGTPAG